MAALFSPMLVSVKASQGGGASPITVGSSQEPEEGTELIVRKGN